jgi:metal-sulfur cluster biosynthetic enzyme
MNILDIKKVLRAVKDPEIGQDIVVLGLVYDIEVIENTINLLITFTTPTCPFGIQIVEDCKSVLKEIPGIEEVNVKVTFDPPWTPERISPIIRSALGIHTLPK